MERKITFRVHALRRMFERGIAVSDVALVVRVAGDAGENLSLEEEARARKAVRCWPQVVEDYPDDKPYPSRLLLGWREGRPLHVVVAENAPGNEWIVITVYEPDPARWEADFTRRKP